MCVIQNHVITILSCRLGRKHAAPSAAMGGRFAAPGGRLWRCRRRVTLLGHHSYDGSYGGREGSPACGTAKGGRLQRYSGRPWRRLERHVAARGGSLKLLSRDFE